MTHYESEGWGFEFLRVYHSKALQINGSLGFSCLDWKVSNTVEMHGNAGFHPFYCTVCCMETFF